MGLKWIGAIAAAIATFAAPAALAGPASLGFIEAELFTTLPDGVRFPEGITANPSTGDIFVGTFDFGPVTNKLVRIDASGHASAIRDFGATPLLGLEFARNKVYILNFGASKLQRISANFGPGTPVEDVATIPSVGSAGSRTEPNPDGSSDTLTFGSGGFPAPNAMVFDGAGNLYISDSFQGAIFEVAGAATCARPCPVTLVSHDPLLATAGTPPFGANGLALSADGKTMYIANTGDHRVLAMDMATKALSVFSISLHGADGLLLDRASGLLWVATNQADHVVALNPEGRIVIKAGEFLGVNGDGAPQGLLFPASLVISGGSMYVTNLALPLTPAVGDEPEDFVTRWTVSRFPVPR
jgi:DNA-binding beta-propeller fold protein YncE